MNRLSWNRLGLRARLSVLYGGLFFAAGSVLLWMMYLFNSGAVIDRFVPREASTVVGRPTAEPEGQAVLNVRGVAERTTDVLDVMLRNSAIAMVVVGGVALLLGYLMADRALRPLEKVTETARRLSESNLHERIALQGPHDEIKRLADTFDAMLGRLHHVFDGQRRFIANASHELRTPLAINRTMLEVSLAEPEASADLKAMARALLGTNARYERLIEGLLLLAQSEQELSHRRTVDLARVAQAVLDEVDLGSRGIVLHRDLSPAVTSGDPLFLERCVHNLVENAIKHNRRRGDVWVTVASEGDSAVLTVENTGRLVSPYEIDDLFEPFHRGDRVRADGSAGLGLSIVRAIVDAHGGAIDATARSEGGLRVVVRLPPRDREEPGRVIPVRVRRVRESR